MKKNATLHARRERTRLRNDTRSLLRSRPLQAVLVAVAGLQLVAVGSGKALHRDEPRTLHDLATRMAPAPAEPMPPVAAVPPSKALKQAHAQAGALATRQSTARRKAARSAAVEELAAKYRDRGFKVSAPLAQAIKRYADANHIPAEVAFGLVRTESEFKNGATSPVGAIGLTQLMPATARLFQHGITRSDLRDPDVNLRIGFRYLHELIDHYDGNTRLALTAYNRGPGIVDRVLKRGGDPDNGYAGKVLRGHRR